MDSSPTSSRFFAQAKTQEPEHDAHWEPIFYQLEEEVQDFKKRITSKSKEEPKGESILFRNPLTDRQELNKLIQLRRALESGNTSLASSLAAQIDTGLIPKEELEELIKKAIEDKYQKYKKEIKEIHKRSNRYIRDTRVMFMQMDMQIALKNGDEQSADQLRTNISKLMSLTF